MESIYKRVQNKTYFDNEDMLRRASSNGDIKCLESLFDSDLKLKYNEDAMNLASGNGHVEIPNGGKIADWS